MGTPRNLSKAVLTDDLFQLMKDEITKMWAEAGEVMVATYDNVKGLGVKMRDEVDGL